MMKAGLNLKAIAQYVGTSVTMIEDNYCGNLELDPTIFQRISSNFVNILASPTGFEPVLSAWKAGVLGRARRRGRILVSRAGFEPATLCLKARSGAKLKTTPY
jgi:hypothetical protein